MNVFVSYPSSISWIVSQIFKHLPSETVRPWIDDQKISLGSSIEEKVAENIENADYVVSFLSEEALSSLWVQKELEMAFRREDALGRRFILPVLLNNFPKESLPDRLRDSRRFLTYQGSSYIRSIAAFANELTDELFRLVCERPVLACEGMAAVYFFNFIEPLSKMMRTAGVLHLERPNKVRQAVKSLQIRLCVVLPESLEDDLEEIRERSRLQEGMLMEEEKRPFKVFYRSSDDLQASESLTLYDVPNILTSAVKLYDNSKLDERHRKRPEREVLNRLELRAFKIRLGDLIAGTLTPKVRSRIDVLSISALA
jgi:hypothetical protein